MRSSRGKDITIWREAFEPILAIRDKTEDPTGAQHLPEYQRSLESLLFAATPGLDPNNEEVAADLTFLAHALTQYCGIALPDPSLLWSSCISFCRLLGIVLARPTQSQSHARRPSVGFGFSQDQHLSATMRSIISFLCTALKLPKATPKGAADSATAELAELALVDTPKDTNSNGKVKGVKQTHVAVEALRTMRVLAKECGGGAGDGEWLEVLFGALLEAVAHKPGSPAPSVMALESERLAWEVLGALAGRGPAEGGLSAAQRGRLADAAGASLEAVVGRGARRMAPEDAAHSKFFVELLHALHVALGEAASSGSSSAAPAPKAGGRGAPPPDDPPVAIRNLPLLVTILHKFLLYCAKEAPPPPAVPASPPLPRGPDASPGPAHSSPAGGGKYCPPHLRKARSASGRSRPEEDKSAQNGGRAQGESGSGRPASGRATWTSSDSDASDSDAGGSGDPFKAHKVRAGALLCLQSLARLQPKSLHAQWTLLLPSQAVLNPRPYTASLATPLLHDRVPKVRQAAALTLAALLEGAQNRQYMAIAESRPPPRRAAAHKPSAGGDATSPTGGGRGGREGGAGGRPPVSRPAGAFTTLSASLGDAVVQLHEGLVHSVAAEAQLSVLGGTFKALRALIGAAPYARLPPALLPQALRCVRTRVQALWEGCRAEQSSAEVSACCLAGLRCLAGAATVPQATGLPPQRGAEDADGEPAGAGAGADAGELVRLLQDIAGDTSATALLRGEALTGLRALFKAQPAAAMAPHWAGMLALVRALLGPPGAPLDGQAERLAVQAGKLLAEAAQASSGAHASDDDVPASFDLQSTPPRAPQSPASPAGAGRGGAPLLEVWGPEGAAMATLGAALGSGTAAVRSSGLECVRALGTGCFAELPAEAHRALLDRAAAAAGPGQPPAVRAAACRALGSLLLVPHRQPEVVPRAMEELLACLADSSQPLRIAASWGLANLCATFKADQGQLTAEALARLVEAMLGAIKDNDKVRANGVRALGYLVALPPGAGAAGPGPGSEVAAAAEEAGSSAGTIPPEYIDRIVRALLSCLHSAAVKVQWNVCCALGGLLRAQAQAAGAAALCETSWGPSVQHCLLHLTRTSSNFKIRTHAASALAVPASRHHWGLQYYQALPTLVEAMEQLEDGGGGPGTDMADAKYRPILEGQLTASLVHLLGLAEAADATGLAELLQTKAEFLKEVLMRAGRVAGVDWCTTPTAAWSSGGASEGAEDGDGLSPSAERPSVGVDVEESGSAAGHETGRLPAGEGVADALQVKHAARMLVALVDACDGTNADDLEALRNVQ